MAPPPDNESIEDKLRQSTKLSDKSPDAIVRVAVDGTILYANPASKPLLQECCAVDTETNLEKMMPLIADTFASEKTKSKEIDCKGTVFSFYMVPFPDEGYVTLYGRDITERKHMEEKLRQSEQRLALVMRGTNDGIWDFDLRTGEIYFSPRWKKMLGYREHEISHRFSDWQDLIHPEDLGQVLDVWVNCMEGLTDSFWVEYRIRAKTGDYIWVLCRGLALRDDMQAPIRLAGSHTDITVTKQREETIKNIVLGTSTSIGESFFEAITLQLAKTLGADFTIVGELVAGGKSVKTLAVCAEGNIVDNFEYKLLHTPCMQVIDSEACSYPCSVAKLFPKDKILTNMGIESYIGVPLFGSRGQPLGLLIALSRSPIEHIEYTESIVQIFAARTAAEIERMYIETRMEYLAYHDDLTNLPNRTLIFDRLQQALARATREDTLGALLFIDLDGFKTINDSLGHPTGDLLLKEIGQRLLRQQRAEDSVGRMGGDEFVVLLPNLGTNRDSVATDVQAIAEKIRNCLAKPVFIDNHELRVTLSIGIVLFPYDADNAEELISQADTAMYRAKEQGRDMIQFYHPAMQLRVMERLALQNDLHNAIKNHELQLYFQPQVDILTGQIIGAEALLRWWHPERGMVSPAEFIPLAEETGQILPIGTWVLETACMQLREFIQIQHDDRKKFSLSVNVSPYQFRQKNFVDLVKQFTSKADIDPASLTLEFTEGMLMHDTEDIGLKLDALKKLGVCLAIDDFGTGYSSLSYLKCFPLDILKIDQSFVRDITTDANDAAIVRAIILMAESLNLEVIAEGIETQTQLDFLKKEGCLSCQGYFYYRPMPAGEFTRLLSENRADSPSIASSGSAGRR